MIKAFIFTLLMTICIGNDCPPEDVLMPCKCISGRYLTTILTCEGNNIKESNISDIKIKMKLKNIEPYFDSISFIQTSIVRIERDIFSSFTALNLSFYDNPNLEYIHIDESSKKIVEVFRIEKSISYNDSDIMTTAKQYFPNLTTIEITRTGITEVPNNAFNIRNSKLIKINLSYNQIRSLGKNAFNLTRISEINLSNNKLSEINRNSFIFNNGNTASILIDLQNNFLNETSFEDYCFNTSQPIILYLQNNNLQYLEKTVFRPITQGSDDNRIEVFGNPFHCDCSSKWIAEIGDNLRKKIIKMKCPDLRYIEDHDESYFQNCTENSSTQTITSNTSITTSSTKGTSVSNQMTTTDNTTFLTTNTSETITTPTKTTVNATLFTTRTSRTVTAHPPTHSVTISATTLATTESPDPSIKFKNQVINKLSVGSENSRKIVAAVKRLEADSNDIRKQLNENISQLKEFESKIDGYHDKYSDNFEINLLMQESKDEVQNLIKTLISINDKLNEIVNN